MAYNYMTFITLMNVAGWAMHCSPIHIPCRMSWAHNEDFNSLLKYTNPFALSLSTHRLGIHYIWIDINTLCVLQYLLGE